MDGWMDGWMVGWMKGWMDGWTDSWTDRQTDRQYIYIIHKVLAVNIDYSHTPARCVYCAVRTEYSYIT